MSFINKTNNSTKNKDTTEKKDELLLDKHFYIALSMVFFLFAIIFFGWGRNYSFLSKDYVIDNSLWGTFGDFVGGVLGTIFTVISVLLVVKTFIHQQTVTTKSNEQLEVQRFNDLFFELIHIYQSQVEEMYVEEILSNGSSIKYTGKEFFDYHKKVVQKRYRYQKSFERNRARCLSYYMLYYTDNQAKLGSYYRTLYRICDLIELSKLGDKKRDYIKIVRAQLTSSELFFLRYNAMSYHGARFREYINKYHLLKHLHAFELLEFKDWWKNLSVYEREGVNISFEWINKMITKTMNKDFNNQILPQDIGIKGKYRVTLYNRHGFDICITIEIDPSTKNHMAEMKAFDNYTPEEIEQLLDFFLLERFVYSNFESFNPISTVELYSRLISKSPTGLITICRGIRSNNGKPLSIIP